VKTRNALRLVVLSIAIAGSLALQSPAAEQVARDFKSPVLDLAQIDALLAKPEQIVLIDLRRPDEHQSKGAFPVFLSIQADELEKYVAYIPRDRQVITVSNHQGRAGKAADLLASKGFKVLGVAGAEIYAEAGGKNIRKLAAPAAASVAPAAAAKK
jgi:rhodanese-related sulfurtransferase